MEHLVTLLQFPFVQRAFVAGFFAAALLAVLGIFVTLKKMSFFSEGIAHASLAGVAIGILLGKEPLLWALIFSVCFASAMYILERKSKVSSDALIGILFTASLALGIILLNVKSGYQPDLLSFLFGNILTIKSSEVWIITCVSFSIIIFLYLKYKTYLLLSLNKELAKVSNISVEVYNYIFYILLAIATVLSIKILGIVLVTALLITPVSSAKLIASSAKNLLWLSILFSEVALMGGIFISLLTNLPTSSLIILTSAAMFICTLLICSASKKNC